MCRRRVTLPCSVQIDAACSVWLLSSANKTVLCVTHGTAWGKIQHVVSETLYRKYGNIALCIMGL